MTSPAAPSPASRPSSPPTEPRGKRRRVVPILLPVVVLAAAIAGFAGLKATKPKPPPSVAEEKAWPVEILEVRPGRRVPELILYGNIESPRQADLKAAVAADVTKVTVLEGARVRRADPLVFLDDRDIVLTLRSRAADLAEFEARIASEQHRFRSDQAALKRERALLGLARRTVTRNQDLNKRKMAAESALDEARQALERQALAVNQRQLDVDDHEARLARLEAGRDRTRALLDMARLNLERTRILAPFDGRVTEVPVAPGDRVRVGDRLLTLYPEGGLEVRAQIPYRELQPIRRALASGLPLQAIATVDGNHVEARLDRLAGAANRTSGGIDGLFRITLGSELLAPGRLVSLLLALPALERVVALPAEAVYGLKRVYRLRDGRMQGLEVRRVGERRAPSATANGRMEVLVTSPDLRPGDHVIVTALPNATNGLKVRVVQPDTRATGPLGDTTAVTEEAGAEGRRQGDTTPEPPSDPIGAARVGKVRL